LVFDLLGAMLQGYLKKELD